MFETSYKSTDTYNNKSVKNVGTDNIADSNIVVAGKCRIDADRSFRGTGSHGNDRKTYDDAGNLEKPGK